MVPSARLGVGTSARGLLGIVLVGTLLVPALPARALPVGPPTVSLDLRPTDDPLAFDVTVTARDPDGEIRLVTVCSNGAEYACESSFYPSDPISLRACLEGDVESLETDLRFPTWGSYEVRASTTAGGCPVLGAEESAETVQTVHVVQPMTPIPCASPGTPRATDVGVSPERVEIAAVVPESGPGASFRGGSVHAMEAVVHGVNSSGGVCGREVALRLVDREGDAQRGRRLIQDLADEVFALVVMPDAESLDASITAGDIDSSGLPVVGTTGVTASEFSSDWVWPVGARRGTFAVLSIGHAFDAGARRFGIVWDSTSAWSREARDAVGRVVEDIADATLVADVPLVPGRASYSAEIQTWNQSCGSRCEGVLLALDPNTALTWIAGRPQLGTVETFLPTELFNEHFAANCGRACNGMLAWTDFLPPIGTPTPATTRYDQDVRRTNPTVDTANRLTEAVYTGTYTLMFALGNAGVDLTRAWLRRVLNATPFDIGLTGTPLDWSPRRDANHSMRAYRIVVAQGSFAGWRDETGWRTAP